MKKIVTFAVAAALLAALPACSKSPMAPLSATAAAVRYQANPEVESTTGLKSAFQRIHSAIFDAMDANHDKWVDEYEAGKYMTLEEFEEANTDNDWESKDKLSKGEFIYWSTHVFLWIHTTPQSWLNSFRSALANVFDRLDDNHDGLISRKELNNSALKRLRLSFDYPKLNIHVPIKTVSDADFKAADHTGDGNLSQAEFEDLYVNMVCNAINPSGPPAPPAPPGPAPNPPATGAAAPAPAPAGGGAAPAPAPAGGGAAPAGGGAAPAPAAH